MTCQHEGCNSTIVVDCIRPELVKAAEKIHACDKTIWQQLEEEYIEYFCIRHCQKYGYCWSCGFTQQNLPEMNGNGLCKFCHLV